MQFRRREFLGMAAGAAAVPVLPRIACALNYPARPVRVVVGYAPGSAPDIIGRLLAQWLSDRLGQPFVVENRPGAGTNLATEEVVRAPADGYTVLVVTIPAMLSGLLYDNLHFDFVRDIAPVACIAGTPFLMVTTPSLPAKTLPEFIAYAKANPGKINMASQGTGTLTHIAGELFKMMAGVDMLHVPYHGEMEAQTDLLSGRAQVMFDPIITSLGNVKTGKLRALGTTTATRLDELPDVPAIAEAVPGYEVQGWIGLGTTSGVPIDIIAALNRATNDMLVDPTLKARLVGLGETPAPMTPDDYGKRIAEVIGKLGGAIKFASIKAG